MNFDSLPTVGKTTSTGRTSGTAVHVLVLHNHIRFVRMARSFVEATLTPIASVREYELSHLADGGNADPRQDVGAQIRSERSPSGEGRNAPLSPLATIFCVGIDSQAELPAMWRVMLWSLVTHTTPVGGSLVFFNDGGPRASELGRFFEDLALISKLDYVPANGQPW